MMAQGLKTIKEHRKVGILSLLLSNIVLNEFDWWIASQWETDESQKLKQ